MKKLMKNILIFALLISMLALCACHETPVVPNEPEDPTPDAPNTDVPDDFAQDPTFEGDLLSSAEYVVFDNFGKQINKDFIEENPTRPLLPKEPVLDFVTGEMIDPTGNPYERVFTITSQSEYDRIFKDSVDLVPMDYDKEMYILYTYTSRYVYSDGISGYMFVIKSARVTENELLFTYEMKNTYEGDEILEGPIIPWGIQRFALIRMKKINIVNIIFQQE